MAPFCSVQDDQRYHYKHRNWKEGFSLKSLSCKYLTACNLKVHYEAQFTARQCLSQPEPLAWGWSKSPFVSDFPYRQKQTKLHHFRLRGYMAWKDMVAELQFTQKWVVGKALIECNGRKKVMRTWGVFCIFKSWSHSELWHLNRCCLSISFPCLIWYMLYHLLATPSVHHTQKTNQRQSKPTLIYKQLGNLDYS